MIGGVAAAFSFLTRIPVGGRSRSGSEVGRSLIWFPLVGAVIGALVGGIHAGVGSLTTPLVGAAVAVSVGILVTGGLHEDGLADMADGFGGGWTADQRLEIMKDSRHGTYGVLALACSVAVRTAAVAALAGWEAVVLVSMAHLLARDWTILALALARPARPGGLGWLVAGATSRRATVVAGTAWLAVALVVLGPSRFAALALAGLAAGAAALWLAYRKVGGVTGDVLGGVEQLSESAALVAAAAVTAW
jgi:adenosylcobinamide-GDP ribazoletransferase